MDDVFAFVKAAYARSYGAPDSGFTEAYQKLSPEVVEVVLKTIGATRADVGLE